MGKWGTKTFVMMLRIIILDFESLGAHRAGPMWPYEPEIWPYVRLLELFSRLHGQVGYQNIRHDAENHILGLQVIGRT